jgi:cobalt-zinc-cadmium efflux system membrane fusion protein
MADRRALVRQIVTGVVLAVAGAAVVLLLITPTREAIFGLFARKGSQDAPPAWKTPVELIQDEKGNVGLRLSDAVIENLEVRPVDVERAQKARPIPPQIGTVNFNIDYLYTIRPRFGGEVVWLRQVKDIPLLGSLAKDRDLTFTDTVKQGDLLAVYWSKDLGLAKAALVDAVVNKKLSQDNVSRYQELYEKGAIPLATLLLAEKQLQNDVNAYHSALRPLFVWKLPAEEIKQVEDEAATILKDIKKKRDPEEEIKRWARVEIRAPIYARDKEGKPDADREMVVLERNFAMGELVDPGRDIPLFRLADMTRLQIWVHPQEEYLPFFRTHLGKNGPGSLTWQVRFQADPPGTPPLELSISKLAPSLDPTLKTPMLIGELKNAERKYLVGQFATATILLPPPENTVEVPTEAVNLVESQNLVFARKKNSPQTNEYFLRRVAVAQTAGKYTLVRSTLTAEDEKLSQSEQAKGRRPIQELHDDEVVLTRGVVELTAALEDALANPSGKKE